MSATLVTREVHTQIRAIIEKNRGASNAAISRETGFSDKTIRRIRRGGRSYVGYKRQLSKDHLQFTTDTDMPPAEQMGVGPAKFQPPKPGLLQRMRARLG
jgi:hypothetical protein